MYSKAKVFYLVLVLIFLFGMMLYLYSEWETRKFVTMFVDSYYNDTETYKHFLHPHFWGRGKGSPSAFREWMTPEYEIDCKTVHLEFLECEIMFTNGARGEVRFHRLRGYRERSVAFFIKSP